MCSGRRTSPVISPSSVTGADNATMTTFVAGDIRHLYACSPVDGVVQRHVVPGWTPSVTRCTRPRLAPPLSASVTEISQPWACTMSLTIARPNLSPPCCRISLFEHGVAFRLGIPCRCLRRRSRRRRVRTRLRQSGRRLVCSTLFRNRFSNRFRSRLRSPSSWSVVLTI